VDSALARVARRRVSTAGAGRTDAGVHALGQVISAPDIPDDLDPTRVRDALNALLAPSIAISGCVRAAGDFHARFSARSRMYIYAILEGEIPDPFLAPVSLYHREGLDVEAMNEAAGHLLGPNNFTSFGRLAEATASPERVLHELGCRRDGRILRIRARANSFLHQMVRSLVGTLVAVGEGRRSPDEMPSVLEARDRAAAGPVAPARGLCLVSVEYDCGWSRPFDPYEERR
jgi:tRNA pseudouridine38-40 synthase